DVGGGVGEIGSRDPAQGPLAARGETDLFLQPVALVEGIEQAAVTRSGGVDERLEQRKAPMRRVDGRELSCPVGRGVPLLTAGGVAVSGIVEVGADELHVHHVQIVVEREARDIGRGSRWEDLLDSSSEGNVLPGGKGAIAVGGAEEDRRRGGGVTGYVRWNEGRRRGTTGLSKRGRAGIVRDATWGCREGRAGSGLTIHVDRGG